ncbi:MAG: cysteine desulfurase family protein [Verrucomicrobiota bacterium]
MIYLDNNATTKLSSAARAAMEPWLGEEFGNPSAGYRSGKRARSAISEAREQVAALVGALPEEITFTSGGTESTTSIIESACRTWPDKKVLLSSSVEHSAVHETMQCLSELIVSTHRVNTINSKGELDLDEWREHLTEDVAIASLIWANNETGVLSPIEAAGRLAFDQKVLFHTDAVQAVGKIPIDLKELPIHSLSISAHKFYGPKGVGALYVRTGVPFQPLIRGGGQESDRRSGTENVASIVAMGVAAREAAERLKAESQLSELRDRLEKQIIEKVEGVEINGDPTNRLPNTSNLFFSGVDGEGLLILLDEAGVCCSPGSACSTGAVKPSRILLAMGHDSKRARSSVRFSLSHMTTAAEIDSAVEAIAQAVGKLRITIDTSRSPVRRNR